MRAVSAARQSPLPVASPALSKDRLKEEAANSALNAWGAAKDAWKSFSRTNRFLKFKVAIVGGWLALSVLSVGVACPGKGSSTSGISLVPVPNTAPTVWMVKNDSSEPWSDVVVEVNDTYRTAVSHLDANNGLTLSPRILTTASGKPAPAKLEVKKLVLETADGRTVLIEGGTPTP